MCCARIVSFFFVDVVVCVSVMNCVSCFVMEFILCVCVFEEMLLFHSHCCIPCNGKVIPRFIVAW